MLLAAVVLVIAGAAALILGLRGTRTDDHPLCRACRFDLVGLAPRHGEKPPAPGGRCPECGADLRGPRAIRVGHRRRPRWALVLASLTLAAGLALGGAGVWAWAAGFDWNTIKPVWWLKAETASADRPTAAAAIAELTDRLIAGRLTPQDAATLADQGLDFQADRDRAWVPQWGDYLGASWVNGVLTPEQRILYVRNAVEPQVRVRPRARRGDRCAVELVFPQARTARGAGVFLLQPRLVSASVGADTLEASLFSGRISVGPGGTSSIRGWVTVDAEPGAYVLETVWAYRALENGDPDRPLGDEWQGTVRTPITVVPADAEAIRLIPDESLREAVRRAVRADPIQGSASDPVSLSGGLMFTAPPVNLAFDVFWRLGGPGGREWPAGSVAVGGSTNGHGFGYGAETPGLDRSVRALDVVLRPSARAAAQTIDMVEVWSGEIVIENVPVEWPDPRPKPR